MLDHAAGAYEGRGLVVAAVTLLAAALAALYLRKRRVVDTRRYHPAIAWLRASLYFCACVVVASYSGALAAVASAPLATAGQLHDPTWLLLTALCFGVIVVAYGMIWPIGTFTDGRVRHPLLSPLYGAAWGASQGLWFLTLWILVARSGLDVYWVAVISYLLIGGYNGVYHRFFWDIQVSPPHNYTEWNGRKVLFCHTPNLLVCLTYLAGYGNAGIFVLLQTLALALSASAMRFPAFWDDYSAEPGRERSIAIRN